MRIPLSIKPDQTGQNAHSPGFAFFGAATGASGRTSGKTWLNITMLAFVFSVGIALAFVGTHWSFKYAFLLFPVLIGGFLFVKNPEIGLLAVVSVIQFEDFNQIDGAGSLIKILSVAALGAYVVHIFINNRDEKLVNTPENIYILLLVLAIMVSNMVAIDPDYAVDKTFKLLRMVAFYLLIINVVRSPRTLHRVFWVMILSGIFSAGYGLYEYYVHPETLMDMRISGTLDDPMAFSYTMAVLLPITWYMIVRNANGLLRALLFAAGLLFLYGIVLSGTRSGMLAAVIVMGFIVIRQKNVLINLTVLVFLLFASYVFMPEQVKSRLGINGLVDKAAEGSTERRETYLVFGLDLFMKDPIIGTGLGGFTQAYSQSEYQYMQGTDDVRRIAHNMYMEIATGAGLLGLIPFLFLLIGPAIALQRTIQSHEKSYFITMAKMVQISLIAYWFIGAFSSSQYDKTLWLLIGLSSVIPQIAKKGEDVES